MALGIGKATDQPGLAEVVLAKLRDAISEGVLAPGQHLTETELAEELGVSRGPIREALAALERERLVVIRRHRGAEVARLSLNDIQEVYSLRVALESLAVRLATQRLTDDDYSAMGLVLDEFAQLTEDAKAKELAQLDTRFHDLIYKAARHDRLTLAWQELRPQVYVFLLSRNLANRGYYSTAHSEHSLLREVLASGDEEAAVESIEAHLNGAYERLVESYEAQG